MSGITSSRSTSTRRVAAPVTSRHRWAAAERLHLTVSDFGAALVATLLAQVLSLPEADMDVATGRSPEVPAPSYWVLSVVIALAWTVVLGLNGSRNKRLLGSGAAEYQRVLSAMVWVLGGLAFLSFFLHHDVARRYVVLSVPLGATALLANRWMARRRLLARRSRGEASSRVLTIEDSRDMGALANHIMGCPTSGLLVAGQIATDPVGQLPDNIARLAEQWDIDAVVVSASANLSPAELSRLMWALESVGADLVLAPSLSGIAGPRLHTRPVEGLPLLYVQGPRYAGAMHTVKYVFDKVVSAAALLVLLPVFVAVALAVKLTSPGPVFYRQVRVGLNGSEFLIWKFRSMSDGADAQLQRMAAENGHLPPLVKFKNDARVTPVGLFLRKWSIDELPQLINVLEGSMSLVGPRPQRPAEVCTYTETHARRLKTKPGMTGMWQVSGRSDVAWDEAVRMDLYYVENWSLSLDLVLIWRTVFAVLRGRGAY